MTGFKPACVSTHLPVRQRTQTGADRRRQDILAAYGYENVAWLFSTVLLFTGSSNLTVPKIDLWMGANYAKYIYNR